MKSSTFQEKKKKVVVKIERGERPDFEEVRLQKEILHLDKALKIKQRAETQSEHGMRSEEDFLKYSPKKKQQ